MVGANLYGVCMEAVLELWTERMYNEIPVGFNVFPRYREAV